MKTSKVHTGTVVGVLALPLIAVLAMVMFFAWGQGANDQAQAANQGSAVAMELRVPANAEVGSKFTIEVAGNLTPSSQISAFGLDIVTGAGVSYNGSDDCASEVKVGRVDAGALGVCLSQASIAGGHLIAVVSLVGVPPLPALDVAVDSKVSLANLTYSCDTLGTTKITLTHESVDPDGAVFGDLSAASIAVKAEDQGGVQVADSTSIECVPASEDININVTDSVLGTKLTDSCFLISVDFLDTGASPPAIVNKPFDIVSDNGAKAACDGLGPIKGDLSDSNPADGALTISVSGKDRATHGDSWHVQQIQTQTNYNIDATKSVCDLSAGKCTVPITNQLKSGTLNITVNNNVTGGALTSEVCFDIAPGTKPQVCTSTGSHSQKLDLGTYTVTIKPTKLAAESLQLKAGASATLDCVLDKATEAGRTCDLTFGFEGQKVFHLKTPSLSNLFLTNQQGQAKVGLEVEVGTTIAPQTCRAGTDVALFTNSLSLEPASISPKGDPQSVAAFEMEVRYDPKWVCVNVVPGDYWFLQANKTNPFTGNVRAAAQAIADSADPVAGGGSPISLTDGSSNVVCFIDDKNDGQQPTGLARIGCVFTGKTLKDIDQTVPLAYVLVKPQPEVYNQIIPNQENGIKTMVLNAGCNLADDQGHPIDSSGCDDASLTIRWLEADFNGDCVVDVLDQQAVALRWGAKAGSLLYNARMDTMPYGNIQGDQRIDIKDVQFAYGRNGSVCDTQNRFKLSGPTHPDQSPVPNK